MTRAQESRDESRQDPRGAFAGLFDAGLISRAMPALRALSCAAADLVFPPACPACRQATEAHVLLCAGCWSKVRFIERPFCERIGVPFPIDLGNEGLVSPEAVANPPVYSRRTHRGRGPTPPESVYVLEEKGQANLTPLASADPRQR
jgi:hypothetical protein